MLTKLKTSYSIRIEFLNPLVVLISSTLLSIVLSEIEYALIVSKKILVDRLAIYRSKYFFISVKLKDIVLPSAAKQAKLKPKDALNSILS